MKNIDEARNYFIEEIKQSELKSEELKKACKVLWGAQRACKVLIYIEHLLILVSSITGCVYISVFASLVGISVCIVSYAVEKTFCAVTTVIKKYKSMIKKRKKKHDKIPVEKSKISQKP